MDKLFPIAKITNPVGLDGEVRVRPLSRFFEEYVEEKPLFLGFHKKRSHSIRLETKKGTGKRVRYKFEGVNSRNEAVALVGQVLFASASDTDGIFMVSGDIIGYHVIMESGEYVGELAEVLWLPGNDVYVLRAEDGREILIPVIEEVVKKVDNQEEVIVISPMEGLLD